MFMKMFQSKKFTTVMVGLVLMVLNDKFGWGVDPETVTNVVKMIMAYVVGQGIADGFSGGKTSSITETIEATPAIPVSKP